MRKTPQQVYQTRKIAKKKRYEKYPWYKTYYGAKHRAIGKGKTRKNHEFTLTLEQAKELWYRDKAHNFVLPSIDRIDNTKGYTFDNCRFLEYIENLSLYFYPEYKLIYKLEPL